MAIDPRYEFSKTQINIIYAYVLVELLITENITGNLHHCRVLERFKDDLKIEFRYLEARIRSRYINDIKKAVIRVKEPTRRLTEETIMNYNLMFEEIYLQSRDERILWLKDFIKERYFSMILSRGEGEIQALALVRGNIVVDNKAKHSESR